MFVKRLMQKAATSEFPLQAGSLKGSHLDPRLTLHYGIPATASILAYDPLQHLLAISTRDGRIKLFGGNGVEGLLQSNSQASSRFLEFLENRGILVHITTHNHIEIWSLEKRQLLQVRKWTTVITAFATIPGSPFMFIGDESGAVSILEYNDDSKLLNRMPYYIPAQVVLGEITKFGDTGGPCVVSILPQPESLCSRVVIAYANGLICLWGVHEAQVLAIRGGTEAQHKKLAIYTANGSEPSSSLRSTIDDENEKEICCACWACPVGSIVAVGYSNGDIYLWGIPTTSKGKGQTELEKSEGTFLSRKPILKLEVSQGIPRMPVVVLRWCTDEKDEAGGRLYAFGGHLMGCPEVLKVLPLNVLNGEFTEKGSSHLELPLRGSFSDMILLPSAASNSSAVAAAVLILTAPGQLDVYNELSITNFLKRPGGLSSASLPEPFPFKLPLTRSSVTAAKLAFLPADGTVAKTLFQIPIVFKSYVPPILKSGTKWPVTGGIANFGVPGREAEPRTVYITGHEDGAVNMWDVSSISMFHVASLEMQCHAESRSNRHSAISAIDFCAATGLLAVGNQDGLVCLYTLSAELRETKCHFVNTRMEHSEKLFNCAAGLQCLASLDVHHSSIQCVVISHLTACLAIGDDSGLVSLFEFNSFSLYYRGRCFPDSASSIVAIRLLRSTSAPTAPRKLALSESRHSGSIAYILAKDSSMTAVDLTAGGLGGSGPLQPRNPSIAVSMHLLDSSGAPATLISRIKQPISSSKDPTSGDRQFMLLVDSQEYLTSNIQRHEGHSLDDESGSSDSPIFSNNLLLLLCSEDYLRLYPAAAIAEGDRNTLRKVKLNGHCCWAELFESKTANAHGLVLLYKSGLIELRSLPDMELLKEQSLSLSLNWRFEPSLMSVKTLTCTAHGRIALIDREELIYLSLLVEENNLRLPSSLPHLYGEDVTAATNAAVTSPVQSVKRKSQIQDLLGGVRKELRSPVSSGDQLPENHGASELYKIFAAEPDFMSHSPTVSAESALDEAPVQSTRPRLEIDDINLEDDDVPSSSPSAASKTNIVKKLKKSLKGKRRNSHKDDLDDRHKLFEGGKPSVRSADEIKAAYGHRIPGEASTAAGLARDKLLERQEKLQTINKRTEEMQAGAETFASLAEELAKKMEARKWWEI